MTFYDTSVIQKHYFQRTFTTVRPFPKINESLNILNTNTVIVCNFHGIVPVGRHVHRFCGNTIVIEPHDQLSYSIFHAVLIKELCIIMLGGGPLAFSVYFSTIIAIIRAQKSLIFCYGGVSLMSLAVSKYFVQGGGITGASWMYVMLMSVLALSLFVAMYLRLDKERKEIKGK